MGSQEYSDNKIAMLDTVVLKIKGKRVWVTAPHHFKPEFKERRISDLSPTESQESNTPYIQKFTLKKKCTVKNYYVKIEIYESFSEKHDDLEYNLRLEFSVPKLIFMNNFQEIRETDIEPVLNTLHTHLSRLGVKVSKEVLSKASVSAVHFGKNIILPKEMMLRKILSELLKTALGKVEDVTKSQYRNGNETVQLFSGVREYSFYDKIRDMQKTDNKSSDKNNRTKYENNMIEMYNLASLECFRFEYRLKNYFTLKSEINSILERSYDSAVIFSDLFSEKLWKEILLQSWRQLIDRPQNQITLIACATDDISLLAHILKRAKTNNESAHSQNQALWSYGLALMFKNHGVKMIKDEINKAWSSKCGERLEDKIRTAANLVEGLSYSDEIMYIDRQLELFERIELDLKKIGAA